MKCIQLIQGLCLVALLMVCAPFNVCSNEADIVVYGTTPGGIAAALAAGSEKHNVLLVEPASHIGGLVTNGLSHTDFRTFEAITGTFFKFSQRVEAHYRETYGENSPQVKQCFRGTHSEPKVNLAIFHEMISEHPSIQIQHEWVLESVETENQKIQKVVFEDGSDQHHEVQAKYYIDGTYEGDLMAMAGVPYRVGREARSEYGESLAPEKADNQVQGYNFRLIMTQDPDNQAPVLAPKGYNREDYVGVIPLLKDGTLLGVFGYSPSKYIYKDQIPKLPNQKVDINDVSHSPVRLSLPQINDEWPDGDAETRARIYHEHVLWNIGMLYFLQNDDAVPDKFEKEARRWGWCKDEFVDNGHLPPQLYVREARRMVGQKVFTENNTDYAPGDARSVLRPDAVAMGDYGLNCHGTGHEGSRFGGRHTGEFYKSVPPYQIPYGVIVPKQMENLLVPVAASSSHVGFCALRLEPIWTGLGQAAGHAASLAFEGDQAVQEVSPQQIRNRMHNEGAATLYVSDVPPTHPDFEMVQWWANAGGLHGLYPQPENKGQRGEHITGQYYEAWPGHEVELQKAMDQATYEKWKTLALDLGFQEDQLPTLSKSKSITRGEWLKSIWNIKNDS